MEYSRKRAMVVGALCATLLCAGGMAYLNMYTSPTEPMSDVAEPRTSIVRIGETAVRVEVVDTPELRKRGLSGHEALDDNEGMLFVFPTSDMYAFWMPDMLFAIDIIWIDRSFRAVHVKENATPESYPEVFRPLARAKYVLEVPAGFVAKHSIALGAQVVVE